MAALGGMLRLKKSRRRRKKRVSSTRRGPGLLDATTDHNDVPEKEESDEDMGFGLFD